MGDKRFFFYHPVYLYRFRSLQRNLTPVRRTRSMALALQKHRYIQLKPSPHSLESGLFEKILKLIIYNPSFIHRMFALTRKKTAHSTQIVKGLLDAVEQDVMDHLSRLTTLSASLFPTGHMNTSEQSRISTPNTSDFTMDCCHSTIPCNSWPFSVVLYRTTPLDAHPQNVCRVFHFQSVTSR